MMRTTGETSGEGALRRASVGDAVRLGGALLAPWDGVRAALWGDWRAVRLRHRYGPGPLRIALPGRRPVLVLTPDDAHRVLTASAEFAPTDLTGEGGIPRHLLPHRVPAPPGEDAARRRGLDEEVLDAHQQVHRAAGPMMLRIQQEAARLLETVAADGELTWGAYAAAYRRLARRLVLGDAARDDRMLTDAFGALLAASAPGARIRGRGAGAAAEEVFRGRLRAHIERAEPESLAGRLTRESAEGDGHRLSQVARWLSGFGAAGVTAYRTLVLLAARPDRLARVRDELSGLHAAHPPSPVSVPYLRACALEAARLWPVVPTVWRRSVAETRWGEATLPAGSTLLVVLPLFGRDGATLPYADRFEPDVWLDGRAVEDGVVAPFGAGSGRCPGESLALMTVTLLLAGLLRGHEPRLSRRPRGLDPGHPLPRILDHGAVRVALDPLPAPVVGR
ncbi:cytochrome P450 [Thermomonospora catenispora]|uniref:cytochrome P450 n=1 Tax=Thermomonospora catenispora TaxID=2493090 RepID=UPI0011248B64|nr:cytochrome P450 [Thermomonospora catenispora]TNY36346.1 cytochrome P450 [Thermomonospora catenispora]